MKKILLFLTFILPVVASAQDANPKQWDKIYFGSNEDYLSDFIQTSDGGYIFAGKSKSIAQGDKTDPGYGAFDWWIIKTDAAGNKQWDKTFGGTDEDNPVSIKQTPDGGYVIGGISNSGNNGTKSQASFGGKDYWLIKTDSLGQKQWDRTYGGTGDDEFAVVLVTVNGYLLGGTSNSGISGNKTQASKGKTDFWVITTDAQGSIINQVDLGGSGNETLGNISLAINDGFILGGTSNSGISGDKSQVSTSDDYWVVKTDANLTKHWDKTYGIGGILKDIQTTSDGGYILGGNQIVKTDSNGNQIWNKIFFQGGGWGPNEMPYPTDFQNLQETPDGGFLLSSWTGENVSSDKSSAPYGPHFWLIKIDQNGNKRWDRTIQRGAPSVRPKVKITSDGNFMLAGQGLGATFSPVYWAIKFGSEQAYLKEPHAPFSICAGDSFTITDYAINQFQPNNTFTAELSNANGNFNSPVTIGSVTGNIGSPLKVAIPLNTPDGIYYRIRLTASNPGVISYSNWNHINIKPQKAPINISNNSPVMTGGILLLKADSIPNAIYHWSLPDGSTANTPTLKITNINNTHSGTYALTYSANGCNSKSINTTVTVNPLTKTNQLLQNFPNPFSTTTEIPFLLAAPDEIELIVFNYMGQLLLKHKHSYPAGENSIKWNEISDSENLRPGTYYYMLKTSSSTETKSMILLKQ